MAKKNTKKKKKKFKPFDKMTFEGREKIRSKLKQERVYTKSFKTPQSFGAAGKVVHINVEEFLKEHGDIFNET